MSRFAQIALKSRASSSSSSIYHRFFLSFFLSSSSPLSLLLRNGGEIKPEKMMKSVGCQFPAIISLKTQLPLPTRIFQISSRSEKRTEDPPGNEAAGNSPAAVEGDVSVDSCKEPKSGKRSRRKVRNAGNFSVSMRKLAARLWHLQLPEASVGG